MGFNGSSPRRLIPNIRIAVTAIVTFWRRFCWLCCEDPDPCWLELWSAWVACYWGVVLLLPFDTFGAQQSSQFYKTMADAMSEDAWGATCVAIGLSQGAGLWTRRYWWGEWLPWAANSLAGGLWAVIAFTIWTAAPFTASPGIHGGLAMAMFYATWYRVRWPHGA